VVKLPLVLDRSLGLPVGNIIQGSRFFFFLSSILRAAVAINLSYKRKFRGTFEVQPAVPARLPHPGVKTGRNNSELSLSNLGAASLSLPPSLPPSRQGPFFGGVFSFLPFISTIGGGRGSASVFFFLFFIG